MLSESPQILEAHRPFISADTEPVKGTCTDIGRMPRGSVPCRLPRGKKDALTACCGIVNFGKISFLFLIMIFFPFSSQKQDRHAHRHYFRRNDREPNTVKLPEYRKNKHGQALKYQCSQK